MKNFDIDLGALLLKFFFIAAGWAASFLSPLSGYLFITIALVFIDLFTGIRAAQKRGEVVKSKTMRNSITKIIYYFMAILLAAGVENVFFANSWYAEYIPLTFMVAGVIAGVEFKSNLENIGSLTGIDIWEVVKDRFNLKKKKDEE